MIRLAAGLLAAWSWGAAAASGPAADELLPFALVVGHNDGGAGMVELRYAHRDARKLRDVFLELGRLEPSRVWTELDPEAAELRRSMAELDAAMTRARAGGRQVLLIFYYSGHAKDGYLRLGDSRLGMHELKQWLNDSPAQVRLALLDSCQSGELTRLKGGRLAPGLVEMESTRGHIIVTSSAASEGSQESDEIGGSFFTHYVVSGLRGDADASGDGSVSLREVYQYAYDRTVHRTASTRGGIQHPTYGYRLSGRGEIPLTRTGSLDSGLRFPAALAGNYLIYDLDAERIAAELNKRAGRERLIALAPGRYAIKKRRRHDLLLGQVEVAAGGAVVVDDAALVPTAFEDDTTKGLVRIEAAPWQIGYSLRLGAEAFFDAPTRRDLFYTAGQVGFQLAFHDLLARNLVLTFDLLLAAGEDETRVVLDTGVEQTVAADFLRFQLGAGLYYQIDWSWFGLYGGPRLVLLIASRDFGPPLQHYEAQSFGSLSPGVAAGLVFHIGSWDLLLEGRVNYLYYNVDGDASLGYGGGYLGVAYRH